MINKFIYDFLEEMGASSETDELFYFFVNAWVHKMKNNRKTSEFCFFESDDYEDNPYPTFIYHKGDFGMTNVGYYKGYNALLEKGKSQAENEYNIRSEYNDFDYGYKILMKEKFKRYLESGCDKDIFITPIFIFIRKTNHSKSFDKKHLAFLIIDKTDYNCYLLQPFYFAKPINYFDENIKDDFFDIFSEAISKIKINGHNLIFNSYQNKNLRDINCDDKNSLKYPDIKTLCISKSLFVLEKYLENGNFDVHYDASMESIKNFRDEVVNFMVGDEYKTYLDKKEIEDNRFNEMTKKLKRDTYRMDRNMNNANKTLRLGKQQRDLKEKRGKYIVPKNIFFDLNENLFGINIFNDIVTRTRNLMGRSRTDAVLSVLKEYFTYTYNWTTNMSEMNTTKRRRHAQGFNEYSRDTVFNANFIDPKSLHALLNYIYQDKHIAGKSIFGGKVDFYTSQKNNVLTMAKNYYKDFSNDIEDRMGSNPNFNNYNNIILKQLELIINRYEFLVLNTNIMQKRRLGEGLGSFSEFEQQAKQNFIKNTI